MDSKTSMMLQRKNKRQLIRLIETLTSHLGRLKVDNRINSGFDPPCENDEDRISRVIQWSRFEFDQCLDELEFFDK